MKTEMEEPEEQPLNHRYWASFPNLLQRYDLLKEIGHGGYATVFLCRSNTRSSNIQFACKSISTASAEYADLIKEMEIMKQLSLSSAPGVVHLLEVIQDHGFWHFIMDLCQCNLTELINQRGNLSEIEAALLIRNLALAIRNLHNNNIIHRDLKPANILVPSASKPYDIRVSDFGLSARFSGSDAPNFKQKVGTPRYFAPELVQRNYSKEIDIWGLGLILYQVLTGLYPFSSLKPSEVEERMLYGEDLARSHLNWPVGLVSEEAKRLVLAMLQPDPEKRISLQQILSHPWILKHYSSALARAKQNVMKNLMQAHQISKRKRPSCETGACMVSSKIIKFQRTNGVWQAVKPCAIAC